MTTTTDLMITLLVLLATGCSDPTSVDSPIVPAIEKPSRQPPLPVGARTIESAHFTVHSSANDQQTKQVIASAEALFHAYTGFFADMSGLDINAGKMQLVLYKDQAQFKAHNRSSPWAEAYYLPPRSHAYYSEGDNAVHWMTHEITHQLNREVANFNRMKWSEEGLAAYFGSSWMAGGTLTPGRIDPGTYPIWWLPSMQLSGDLQKDIAEGRIIPLRAIISGKGGPDINQHVNLYYVEYWSLTHFLFQYQDGKYAQRYRDLIHAGGTLEQFERIIGPLDRIEGEWYDYLHAAVTATREPA